MASILASALSPCAQAQSVPGGNAEALFTGLDKANASITVTPRAGATNLAVMTFTGTGQGGTKIDCDLTGIAPKKQTLKLYSGQLLVSEMPIPNGPSAPDVDVSWVTKPVQEATFSSAEEDWWWIVVAAVVLICVHEETTVTTTYDANGNVTGSTVTTTSGWDCPGGGNLTAPVSVNGQVFQNISRIQVVAETSAVLPPVSSTTFSAAGGARITSVR